MANYARQISEMKDAQRKMLKKIKKQKRRLKAMSNKKAIKKLARQVRYVSAALEGLDRSVTALRNEAKSGGKVEIRAAAKEIASAKADLGKVVQSLTSSVESRIASLRKDFETELGRLKTSNEVEFAKLRGGHSEQKPERQTRPMATAKKPIVPKTSPGTTPKTSPRTAAVKLAAASSGPAAGTANGGDAPNPRHDD